MDNMKQKKPQQQYKQRYRPQWEDIPENQGWLQQSSESPYLGFCTVCRTNIQAHKKDISRHANCKKHLRNIIKDGSFAQFAEYGTSDEYRVITYESDGNEESLFMEAETTSNKSYEPVEKKPKISGRKIKIQPPSPSDIKRSSSPIPSIPTVVEKCSRWCCQLPEAPPVYEDALSTFGRFVADEIRGIPDSFKKQKAKIKINTVLFQASVGQFNTGEIQSSDDDPALQVRPQLQDINEDQLSGFGKYVASELKSIPDRNARVVAKQLICSILFKASSIRIDDVTQIMPHSPQMVSPKEMNTNRSIFD